MLRKVWPVVIGFFFSRCNWDVALNHLLYSLKLLHLYIFCYMYYNVYWRQEMQLGLVVNT